MDMIEYLFEVGRERLVKIKNQEGEDAVEFALSENMQEPYRYLCK